MTDRIEFIKSRISMQMLCGKLGIDVNRNGFAHSVYKQERTPSMKVRFNTNRFKCYATDQGGDVIELYKAYAGCDLKTAIDFLYNMAGGGNVTPERRELPATVKHNTFNIYEYLTDEDREYYDERMGMDADPRLVIRAIQAVRLRSINIPILHDFLMYCLDKFQLSSRGAEYLRSRGFTDHTIRRFRLCAITDYKGVSDYLKKRHKMEDLQRSGLFNKKEDGSGNLIFFKHRIVIPYFFNNQPVYIRCRYFDEEGNPNGEGMKYLGLRDDGLRVNAEPRFFNLDVLKSMIKGEKLYITEGEFDAIAIEQMGYNAVGVPGSGNMPEDMSKLKDYKIILCLDNDTAGQGLKDKLLERFTLQGNQVAVKLLPTKDVNELLMMQNAR